MSTRLIEIGKSIPLQIFSPSCFKKCTLALAIITVLGGTVIGGVGLAGFLNVGALSHMAQIKAIIMMGAGGGAAGAISIFALIIGVKKALSRPQIIPPSPQEQFVANTSKGTIRGEHGFNARAWAEYLSIEVDTDCPNIGNFFDILDRPCPFSGDPKIKVRDTHMLVFIPSTLCSTAAVTRRTLTDKPKQKPFTLKNLNDTLFRKNYCVLQGQLHPEPTQRLFDEEVKEAHWVLMIRDVIPGSRNLSYQEQIEFANQYPDYRLPTAQEVVACAFAERAASESDGNESQLFGKDTYTLCADSDAHHAVVVGGHSSAVLSVQVRVKSFVDADPKRGVALVRPL